MSFTDDAQFSVYFDTISSASTATPDFNLTSSATNYMSFTVPLLGSCEDDRPLTEDVWICPQFRVPSRPWQEALA